MRCPPPGVGQELLLLAMPSRHGQEAGGQSGGRLRRASGRPSSGHGAWARRGLGRSAHPPVSVLGLLLSNASRLISAAWSPRASWGPGVGGRPESWSFGQAVLQAGTFLARSRAGLRGAEKDASPRWAPARQLGGPCPVTLRREERQVSGHRGAGTRAFPVELPNLGGRRFSCGTRRSRQLAPCLAGRDSLGAGPRHCWGWQDSTARLGRRGQSSEPRKASHPQS